MSQSTDETADAPDRASLMHAVERGLEREGGRFVITLNPERSHDPWVVGIEFGKEAPDSDMAGGAAYGMGDTMKEALAQAVDETGWLRQ